MANVLSKETLEETARLITSLMGLYFPEDRLTDLERGLASASRELGFADIANFIKWLKSSPMTKESLEIMASHLTVGETYFFREKDTLSAVETRILPEIIKSKRTGEKRLRIWSAGCSTGEEPYTIAIILHRLISDITDWNITILATDINPMSLKKARRGVYGEWSFRNSPEWLKSSYFKRAADNGYEIAPFIKNMVTFEYLNLADDVYPSLLSNTNAMDIIFCRNVLMYFRPDLSRKVVTAFYNSLMEKGFLLVSPCETLTSITTLFAMENHQNATLYRKDSDAGAGSKPALYANRFDSKAIPAAPAPQAAPMPKQTAIKRPSPLRPAEDDYAFALRMFNDGRFKEAAKRLEESLGGGADARSAILLARIRANAGELEDALKWCEKAVAANRLDPYCHYLRATILQEEGRLQDAVEELKRALYLDHGFVLAYFVLGSIFLKLGDEQAGARNLKNALEILSAFSPDAIIPESEGITAGRLVEIISSMAKMQ
ncbi:MAG: tetratricopeptide repeat protein [Deltaproteobacteria bacterium]|nr:tetratricopeptide repeat protein [Deltaproteobacteria bacterium]